MSKIRELYSYLSSINIEFVTELGEQVTISASDLHQLKNSVASANLPRRLLLPIGYQEGSTEKPMTACGESAAVWRIADLMLWRPAAQGLGLADVAADLVRYTGAYASALKNIRNGLKTTTGLTHIMLQETQIEAPDVHPFPSGSQTATLGVRVWLTFKELL